MPDDMPALIPPGPKLSLKKKAEPPPPPVQRHVEEAQKAQKANRSRKKKKIRPTNRSAFLMGSLGSFLVGALIFGGLLYHQFAKLGIISTDHFHLARAILVSSLLLVLVIDAFVQDMMQGVISLFFPPYTFVYGLLFADNGPIRGLTVALLLFLGGEIWLTPKDSLAIIVQRTINEWISSGQNALMDKKPDAGFERR